MEKIIIDTDPGIDDAMAILLAANAGDKLCIEALTTVNGNVGLERVIKNVFTILNICKRGDLPVYKGAELPLAGTIPHCGSSHGDDGLGGASDCGAKGKVQEEAAADALVRLANEHAGELSLMPIGPLTNIAKAVRKDSGFAEKIKRVVLMGGAEHGGNMSPVAEFNFWHDPEAAEIVFNAGFHDVVMIGLDVTRKAFLSPAMREYLYQINTPVSRFLHRITRAYVDSYWRNMNNLGCELCDVLAAGYFIDDTILELKKAHVKIETSGLCRGMSVVYPCEGPNQPEENCRVAAGLDAGKFFQLFFDCLFPEYYENTRKLISSGLYL